MGNSLNKYSCKDCTQYEACLKTFRDNVKNGFFDDVSEEEYFSETNDCHKFKLNSMSRDKQILGMAKDFCAIKELVICEECHLYKNRCHAKKYATRAYNAGYRKASEVAREIFEEADKIFMANCLSLETYKAWCELKKKYTESEKDNG